jgi:putative peptidoglycan lipid II flippase
MGAATAASRAIGFVRVLVVAAILGTTYLGNAYQSSNSVSNVLFELVAAGALSAVLVPTFVELLDRGDVERMERLAGRLLGLALLLLGVISVIGILAAPWIADLLTRGVDEPLKASQQQDLSTLLLRFFIPQVMLYAIGAVAVAVLYAKRHLTVTAIAPIGYTVVTVVTMVVFRLVTGPDPSVDLTTGEALILAIGGTVGVAAFVGIPYVAAWRSGVRLVPRLRRRPRRRRAARRAAVGLGRVPAHDDRLLLGAAIVVGNSVKGGTVAYQVAFVFFLAPYAILAQPVHTAILSDLARESGEPSAFARSVRWALDNMIVLVVPVSALMIALAYPTMRVVAFGGAAKGNGAQLLAAGLASLAAGLVVYSAFLLFARAYYSLGDSRTPALVALVSGLVGVAVMVGGGRAFHGAATVGMLGVGHSIAYLVGAVVLGVGLHRRTGRCGLERSCRRSSPSRRFAVVAWWVGAEVEPQSRVLTALLVAGLSIVAAPGTCSCCDSCAASLCPCRVAVARATSSRPTRRSNRDPEAPRSRPACCCSRRPCRRLRPRPTTRPERATSSSSRCRTSRGPTSSARPTLRRSDGSSTARQWPRCRRARTLGARRMRTAT